MVEKQQGLNRRQTLVALLGAAAAPVAGLLSPAGSAAETEAATVFQHGVASGDPDQQSLVLWTRVTLAGDVRGMWQLARDPDFANILQSGDFTTGEAADHTVKILVRDLAAGTTYWFRFLVDGVRSPVGRTRTLPDGPLESLGLALVSCSNHAFGFFHAYAAIAGDPQVEFVLHTGDYLYEYGQDGWGDDVARALGRRHEPPHETVSLTDYRLRHAQYKRDAGSLAMLAAHPLLVCWDDHESANNPWVGGAQNHQSATEGDWQARRAASVQAYYEWMPIREPEWLEPDGRSRLQFWRSYRFGDLATLFTLETRHTARAEQIDYAAYATRLTTDADAQRLRDDVLGAAGRPLLDPLLEADLRAVLEESVGGGQPWRLIGNPMPIARTRVPDVVSLGLVADPAVTPELSDAARALAWKGRWNLPFYPDTWDGYAWARERLYELARAAGASDLLFLTGDSHSFWLNQLADAEGRPTGIEVGTAGVTSPGDFIDSGFAGELAARLDQAFTDHNPEVLWTDNLHQGYVRVELTRGGGVASFVALDSVREPVYRTTVLRRALLASEDGRLQVQLQA
jgi:alkaline phosphatase D